MFISFAKITGMGEGCLLSWGEALLGISAGYDQNKKFTDQSSGSSWQYENFGHQNVYVIMFMSSDEVLNVCVIECILCRYVLYQ